MNLGNVICGQLPFLVGYDSNDDPEPALLLMFVAVFFNFAPKTFYMAKINKMKPKTAASV